MFGMPGGIEWIIILVVALLIFGRRLPEVMRSMGKGIVEFKKGIKGIENEVEDESSSSKTNNLGDAYNKDRIKD
ncbi:MAG: Sec-independent protein translocase subunit TatA/TatB [Candidatus Anammoxibacter sp.]